MPSRNMFQLIMFLRLTETLHTNLSIDTIYSTTTVTAGSQQRRWIDPLPPAPSQAGLDKRVTSAGTCTAITNVPTRVPTYASACSGTVRYSSACSCDGIPGGTTTLTPSTVTATSTSTVHVTPTSTITATTTNNVLVTVTQTQTVPATFETTDATTIVPSLYTQITDLVIPTTITVSPPICNAYNFVATNGARAGQFVTGGTPATNLVSYGFVNFTSNAADAMAFTLRSDGRVYGENTYGWITGGSGLYYILQMTDNAQQTYGVRSVYCTVGNGDSSYVGATGTLACTSNGNSVLLQYCPQTSNNLAQSPSSTTSSCTAANLAAVPVQVSC
jgi:hypothetical protein